MHQELRSDRTIGQREGSVELGDRRDRVAVAARADEVAARCERSIIRKQTHQIALGLGELVRRSADEAPEVCERLRHVAEALQLVGARLALTEEQQRLGSRSREDI